MKFCKVSRRKNILKKKKRRKVDWNGHILRGNFLLKLVFEGKIEERSDARTREREEASSNWMIVRNVECIVD